MSRWLFQLGQSLTGGRATKLLNDLARGAFRPIRAGAGALARSSDEAVTISTAPRGREISVLRRARITGITDDGLHYKGIMVGLNPEQDIGSHEITLYCLRFNPDDEQTPITQLADLKVPAAGPNDTSGSIIEIEYRPRWIEDDSAYEYKWHISQRFPSGGGGDTFLVLVKADGGTAGADPADWTYAIYGLTDTGLQSAIAEHLTPKRRRLAAGPYDAARDATYGLAALVAATGGSIYILLDAYDERICVSDCDGCS